MDYTTLVAESQEHHAQSAKGMQSPGPDLNDYLLVTGHGAALL
jgi:hypothetical protein